MSEGCGVSNDLPGDVARSWVTVCALDASENCDDWSFCMPLSDSSDVTSNLLSDWS